MSARARALSRRPERVTAPALDRSSDPVCRGLPGGSRRCGSRVAAAVVALALGLPVSAPAPAAGAEGTITTAAGKSPAGFGGDGGPATEAQMNEPRMMAFDRPGNMYIADTFNHLIRKVDPAGTITTVAGKFTGFVPRSESDCQPDFSGDGGPATQATLSCPHSVAVDGAGNLFIADSANHAIRKVDTNGVITTVAGVGGKLGDTGEGGPGTEARVFGPKGIIFDRQGNLIIADSGNDKIKKLDAFGIITTIAGTGSPGGAGDGGPAIRAELDEPRTLAVGLDGTLYVTEPRAHRVRRIDPSAVIWTFAGTGQPGFSGDGGPATRAQLDFARGVGVDGAGNVFIADSLNQRIRKVDAGGVITTVAGRGDTCYFSSGNSCGDGGPALQAGFATPRAVDVDGHGNLFVADTFNERIRRIEGAAAPVLRP
jgi:sugar lactone lactonase YvrE